MSIRFNSFRQATKRRQLKLSQEMKTNEELSDAYDSYNPTENGNDENNDNSVVDNNTSNISMDNNLKYINVASESDVLTLHANGTQVETDTIEKSDENINPDHSICLTTTVQLDDIVTENCESESKGKFYAFLIQFIILMVN